jgi:hypothetical protein
VFVFNEEREYWTDHNGLVLFPLIRGHRYDITVEFGDFGSYVVRRTIPDQPTYHIEVRA